MFTNYKISIIVPIYNNGYYLKNKCFSSLEKSSMFKDLEIILIDDGSDDEETINTIKELTKTYKNVQSYFLPSGGSGSASRPRNYGVKKATAKYITYLDPDNEASNDGYAKLYNCLKEDNYDLILGNMKRIISEDKILYFSFYNKFINANNGRDVSHDGKDIIKKLNFTVNSIQALIIKKDIVISNDLVMEEGAIGQDTIFFLELIMCSKNIKVIDEEIHIYNSFREDSVTNQLSKNYFIGHYKNENKKVNILEKYGVSEEYFNTKQDYYFKSYIFNQFNQLNSDNIKEIESIIRNTYDLYGGKWKIKDKQMKSFFEDNKT